MSYPWRVQYLILNAPCDIGNNPAKLGVFRRSWRISRAGCISKFAQKKRIIEWFKLWHSDADTTSHRGRFWFNAQGGFVALNATPSTRRCVSRSHVDPYFGRRLHDSMVLVPGTWSDALAKKPTPPEVQFLPQRIFAITRL